MEVMSQEVTLDPELANNDLRKNHFWPFTPGPHFSSSQSFLLECYHSKYGLSIGYYRYGKHKKARVKIPGLINLFPKSGAMRRPEFDTSSRDRCQEDRHNNPAYYLRDLHPIIHSDAHLIFS
jgi:hypothetical protein